MNEILNLQPSVFVSVVLVVATFVIAALGYVVINQRKEITELKTPKYGFLGKPLSVLGLGILMAGSYAIFQFAAINGPAEPTDVSADRDITLQISATEVNPTENVYRLVAVPRVDGNDYGDLEVDVYWTITSQQGNRITEIENDVSRENQSNLLITLPTGNTTIYANIFISSTEFVEREINILVE